MQGALAAPRPAVVTVLGDGPEPALRLRRTPEDFEAAVRAGKEAIRDGEVFQVVLSLRVDVDCEADPLEVYRILRSTNPSPYMYLVTLPDPRREGGRIDIVGSSPETLVRVEGRAARTYPIAGSRPRGTSPEEDRALAEELRADPSAEHLMLVDLGRNELGRVALPGTVQVTDLMVVERYSHVMHLVSNITADIEPRHDAFDLFQSSFPAGTLSGAPKIRAMEIIAELEDTPRGPYGGAVGYFGFNGNMDTCITIRTIVLKDGVAYLQAGAGIVADSDPTTEYHETLHKAGALSRAIVMAEEGI